MRRREFITLLGGAAAWPLAARAQQPDRIQRVGFLISTAETDQEARNWIAAFERRFAELGWSDCRNVRIEYRFGGGTRRACGSLQRSCWNCDLTRFSMRPRTPLQRCVSKLCQYQSFSCRSLTRFRLALSQISRAQKAISPASPISSFQLAESGCRSSRNAHQLLAQWQSYS